MEEIEELRAKAIASMPFSTNPNSSSSVAAIFEGGSCGKFNSLKSREQGEVSSGEDAELATCSVAPTNNANLDESVPYTLKNNAIKAVKKALTARTRTEGTQLRPSIMQNYQKHYHKHLKRKLPFSSLSSQALHWHAKESNDNLVISFSDDDSGSESEERYPEKDVKRMDGTSIAHNSRIAATSSLKPTNGIQRELDGSKPMPKKGFINHETVSSFDSAYETSCEPLGPSAENVSLLNKQNPAISTSATQELGHAQDSTLSDERLEFLRQQIAAQENKLKVQNRSVPKMGATVSSDSKQHDFHAMKRETQATSIRSHAYDTNLEFEVKESSNKRLKHDKSSSVFDFGVPTKPENDNTFHVDNSCSHQQPDSNDIVKSSVIKFKESFLALPAANLHDVPLSENVDVARNGRSELSKKAGVSDLPSSYVSSMGDQQMTPTTDVLMPLKTFSIYNKSSCLGGSVNNEANTTEEGRISFHSLLKLEELHDKELEEAQDYRCKCELEERHALQAYRKAQRSLVEANERLTFLYGKRELFSAKFRSIVMKASNSICPSDWQCQQIPHEDQFYEPDASTSVHRDSDPLEGAVLLTHNPNMSMDDDVHFPSSNKVADSRSNHVDVQIEKEPSLDNSQDYELLEASLRSELVARLGLRASSTVSDTSKRKLEVEERDGSVAEDMRASDDMEPSEEMEQFSLLHHSMAISEAKKTAKFDGIERSPEGSCLLGAQRDFNSLANASSSEELQSTTDLGANNSFPKNSSNTTNKAAFFLPTSGLHLVCRHTYMIFPDCYTDTFNIKENDYIVTSKEKGVTDFIPDNVEKAPNLKRPAPMGYRGINFNSVEIDPFWPLCMFEFRGKCNDEECPWQHMKAGMFPNLRNDEHSNCHLTCLPNGKSNAHKLPCSALLHVLPIPTYLIGPYLIKADSNQSQSVLARCNWLYQQRGFCASFFIPFSVQRILPLDAPCLQPGDDPVADYSWNRMSLSYRSQDDTLSFKEQIKQGSADVEQLLEMALDQLDGELCEPDRRKALSLLSHAIELYPSSVVLWVVFLHIFYKREKAMGKDDMFLHAVRHNKGSYELWLLYINSRILCEDRLNAYDRALNVLCHIGGLDGRKHLSPCILDIFLQMIDFLCMSGHVDKVISRICELLPSIELEECSGNPLRGICRCLTIPDRCLFWTSCTFFIVYEKLPEATVQQFEFVKTLPFGLDWPSVQLSSDRKSLALEFMKLAMTEMASYLDDNPNEIDQISFQCSHFLAVSHVKCRAALLGFPGYTELLDTYLKLYPSCIELVLMAIRCQQNYATDLEFSAFEETLHNWPKETPGIQCLWNQYAEHALTNNRIDLAEKLMARWYQDFPKFRDPSSFCSVTTENSFDSSSCINSYGAVQSETKDDAFGFLNLFLYCMLQKRAVDARSAIDKSLGLAAPEDYNHFVMEQALFMSSISPEPPKPFPVRSISSLLNGYLADPRSSLQSEPLSRKFIRTIQKPKIQQMVHNVLGPVSKTSTLVNSVLKACYGPSLLPEKFDDIKETVSFVEILMEITPTNYELALSVYRIFSQSFIPTHTDCNSVKFWACSLLINSIFQPTPAAPEHIWLEAANALKNSESIDITLWFHKQAISVYPFSVKLWQSYANLYPSAADASEVIEAALERSIDLNNILT